MDEKSEERSEGDFRIERDSIGEMAVPASALYGIQTRRALENFRFTGVTLKNFPNYVVALAQIKKAAARANRELGQSQRRRHIFFIRRSHYHKKIPAVRARK